MKYVLDTKTLIYSFKGEVRVAQHGLAIPPRERGIPVQPHPSWPTTGRLSPMTKKFERVDRLKIEDWF